MGVKRVSPNAAVSAYDERPVVRGCASKVPIQPRSRLSPERDTVFHVTNSGCSSVSASFSTKFVLLLLWLVRLLDVALSRPLGVEFALCRLEELADEGGDARIRDIAAGL